MRGSVLLSFALLLAGCSGSVAQDVVSASSGVLHYFEGTVILDNKPIEHKVAVFPSLANGSTLCTKKGRAELMLTPGAYLRIDENSCLEMVSNLLTDTRLNMTEGSAIVDTLNASPDQGLVLLYQGSELRFPKPGIYRIDSDVSELQVYSGEAKVTHHGTSTTVDPSRLYYFTLELTTSKFSDGEMDEFYDWAHNRSDAIADQNQTASAEQADAQDGDPGGAGAFVVPPFTSSPGYTLPSYAYPTYGAANLYPSYVYPGTPYVGFVPFASIVVLPPLLHRPGSFPWHGGSPGSIYRPTPVLSRWPSSVGGIVVHPPGTSLHSPLGMSIARPATITPHITAPSAAPHVTAPHVGGVGHR